jgi:leucyl aminopeptidase
MLPELNMDKKEIITAAVEGTLLGDYVFDKYKTLEPRAEKTEFMTIITDQGFKNLIDETTIICNNVNLVRDWVNECGTIEHPDEIVEISKKVSSENKIKISVIGKEEMKEKGLNLIYEVGKGSKYSPYLIFLEYDGDPESEERTAIVGKGITFDSGGLNLKPASSIKDMEKDMSGAATVIGIIKTAAEIKLKKNIVAVIGAAENMIGPDAYKPGDIIKSYKGITVEVGNTDAEGRLILGDALSYTVKKYKPSLIIDLATLTGSVVSALGIHTIGMFGNTKDNIRLLEESGYRTYERVWNFPMFQEYKDDIRSEIADIKNIGPKGQAGSISGAVFLEPFVEKTPWIHLDIAGVAFIEKQLGYLPKGGTGVGLRLIVDFLKK